MTLANSVLVFTPKFGGELIVVVSPPARFSDSRGCDEYTEVVEEEHDYVTPPCSASLA